MCLAFLVKHILFVVNLVFVIISLAIIGVGGYALHYVGNNDILTNLTSNEQLNGITSDVNQDVLKYICIIMIIIGVVIFLISFCGCCGSISENRCLLILYAIVMFLFAGVTIFIFVSSSKIFDQAESLLGGNMNHTFYSAEDPVKNETINAIQYSLKCCGPHGPLDDYYNEHNTGFIEDLVDFIFENHLNISGIGYVSPSCCSTFDPRAFVANPAEYIQDFQCTADDVYMDGCVDKIMGYIDVAAKYFKYVIGGIAGFEVLAFIFAVYMCCVISSRNKKRRRSY